jgi:hypothetical protein
MEGFTRAGASLWVLDIFLFVQNSAAISKKKYKLLSRKSCYGGILLKFN